MKVATLPTPKQKPRRQSYYRQFTGLLFVLPCLIFVGVFFITPLFMTAWMSLHDWPLLGKKAFIGIENYQNLLSDKQFWRSLWFTTQYTFIVTPCVFLLGFVLALVMQLPWRGIGFFRTVYFLPVVIGLGTSSLLWIWLLNDRVGLIDKLLLDLGLIQKPVLWLGYKTLALTAVVVSVVWKTVGLTMILLLAGLQSIPKEFYEAARVDGANFWTQLRFITLPLLRRTFALALVLSVIGSYLSFDQFYIMTSGGPRNQTISVVYWIFNNSFTYFDMGYGSALSMVLLLVLVLLSSLQLYLLRDDTNY
jgi:multiple sugar transport system permease protein